MRRGSDCCCRTSLGTSTIAQWLATASLLCAVGAQEAFGTDVSAAWLDFSSLLTDLSSSQRVGMFVTIASGLTAGFVFGRLRRYDWDIKKAWAGKQKRSQVQQIARGRPGIENVSSDDEEVDPATVRGTPEYQRKIRGKALTLLVLLISTYYMHGFIDEKCGAIALLLPAMRPLALTSRYPFAVSAASGKRRRR